MKSSVEPHKRTVELAKDCARFLSDKKASDILIMDLRDVNSYLEYFLIATANSLIHNRALARELQRFIQKTGIKRTSRSNMESGWVVLDYGDLVVHIFTSEMRDYYQLEKLWADAKFLSF